MMKEKGTNICTTEENFRTHLKRRALLMGWYILFGIAMLMWLYLGNGGSVMVNDRTREFFGYFAGALLVIGVVRLVQIIQNIKNPEKFGKAYTEYEDERNRFVMMKTYYYSAYIFILLMALAVVVISALGMLPIISNTLVVCIGAFMLILNITYRIMNRIH